MKNNGYRKKQYIQMRKTLNYGFALVIWLIVCHGSIQRVVADTDVFNDVAYSDGIYMAAGKSGLIVNSHDAITWETVYSGGSEDLNGIASNGKTWIAVGGGGCMYLSQNGADWELQVSGLVESLLDVLWTGEFFVVNYTGDNALTSVDGTNWNIRLKSDPMLKDIIWSGGMSSAFDFTNYTVRLPDASVWESLSGGGSRSLKKVFWEQNQ